MTKMKKKRRCDVVRVTRQAQVLKYLREAKKLSMRELATLAGVSSSTINHAENGRLDLKPDFVLKLLDIYGYSYSKFVDMCDGKIEVPEHLRSECIEMIKRLKEEKLKAVRAILQSF